MKSLFTDASFDWTKTNITDEKVVRGKIAVSGEGLNIVEKVAIGKVPTLKQYINLLELIAIARAVEIAQVKGFEKSLRITTDSKVAMYWARAGSCKANVLTEAHQNAFDYLKRVLKEFGGIVVFEHTRRENNPAGHLLEAELEREPSHTI